MCKAEDAKQLIRKLQHPPCERIVRIEFADGGIYYEISPDTSQASPPINLAIPRGKLAGQPKPERTSKLR
jgi:hypothetical protein